MSRHKLSDYLICEAKYHPVVPPSDILANPLTKPPVEKNLCIYTLRKAINIV